MKHVPINFFKLSNEMAFRLNRTPVTSRDVLRTNQNELVNDVTYLIYICKKAVWIS